MESGLIGPVPSVPDRGPGWHRWIYLRNRSFYSERAGPSFRIQTLYEVAPPFPRSWREGGLWPRARLPFVLASAPSIAIRSRQSPPSPLHSEQSCSISSPLASPLVLRLTGLSYPASQAHHKSPVTMPRHTHHVAQEVGILRLRLIFALFAQPSILAQHDRANFPRFAKSARGGPIRPLRWLQQTDSPAFASRIVGWNPVFDGCKLRHGNLRARLTASGHACPARHPSLASAPALL